MLPGLREEAGNEIGKVMQPAPSPLCFSLTHILQEGSEYQINIQQHLFCYSCTFFSPSCCEQRFLVLFVTGLPLVLQALPGLGVGILVWEVGLGWFFFPLGALFLFLKTGVDP